MTDQELYNFGPIRAKIAIYLANFNDFCSIGWTSIIPEPILEISRQSRRNPRDGKKRLKIEDSESAYNLKGKDDLRLCWSFMAKQIDMTVYYVSTILILCSAIAALSPIWVAYSSNNS